MKLIKFMYKITDVGHRVPIQLHLMYIQLHLNRMKFCPLSMFKLERSLTMSVCIFTLLYFLQYSNSKKDQLFYSICTCRWNVNVTVVSSILTRKIEWVFSLLYVIIEFSRKAEKKELYQFLTFGSALSIILLL